MSDKTMTFFNISLFLSVALTTWSIAEHGLNLSNALFGATLFFWILYSRVLIETMRRMTFALRPWEDEKGRPRGV